MASQGTGQVMRDHTRDRARIGRRIRDVPSRRCRALLVASLWSENPDGDGKDAQRRFRLRRERSYLWWNYGNRRVPTDES